MTYEEYKLLIKAKFDELQNKAYFDTDTALIRAGKTPSYYHSIAYVALAQISELSAIIDQIKEYANGIFDKIREDKKLEEAKRLGAIAEKYWGKDKKE